MRIGWIGLGRVGKQMALRALADGHTLTGHSRRFEHHAEIESAGGQLTASLDDAVRHAEMVCVNVFSEDQPSEGCERSGGLSFLPRCTRLADAFNQLGFIALDRAALQRGFTDKS